MPLEKYIKNLILQAGPISMAEFMQAALSHPAYGYYKTAEPFGVLGDFTTAPEISQLFGELIGIWCADIWQQMGCPSDIEIVEMGPGRGTLMDDLLRATSHVKDFHESISISMVETSPRLRDIQYKKINNKHPRIKWLDNISELPHKPFILVTNELFDALPVHQYIKKQNKLHEKMVGVNDAGELQLVISPNSIANLDNNEMPNDSTLEICPLAITIMEEITARIKKCGGAALIIDYGYVNSEYKNTISAISNHKHHDILQNIGTADISAHVDFTSLANIAKNNGIWVCGAISQGDFLCNMGIKIRVEKLSQKADISQKDALEIAKHRLIDANQMGDLFKVLAVCSDGLVPAGF